MIERRAVGPAIVVIGRDAREVGEEVRALEHAGQRVLAFVGDGEEPALAQMIEELLGGADSPETG